VSIYQWQAQAKALGHTNKGVINSTVAMGVELSHNLTGYAGGLNVTPIWSEPHLTHLIDDSALNWLESVSDIWKGARVNDGVGVLQKGLPHLLGDINVQNALLVFGHIFQLCETWRVSLTLPRPPKDLGAIRHVFASALSSVLGNGNALDLSRKDRVIVVLVDGLGSENLRQRAGHAPFLHDSFRKGKSISASFPATTSVNIGSFATGLMAGEHGLVGHQVWDRLENERINLLVGWNERTDPQKWQPHRLVSEEAFSKGITCNVIAAEEYRSTGFTKATMRQANFIAADSIDDRIAQAISTANSKEASISYVYFPELDKYGHQNGWTSTGWAALLEQIDAGLRRLASKLGGAGLIITADHGMVETARDRQLRLDSELAGLSLEFFGGDTRCSYLYFAEPNDASVAIERLSPLSYAFGAHHTSELIEGGWYGSIGSQAKNRLPEVILLARSNYTLYHSNFSKQRAFDMISHHGSISDTELKVPLIRIGF
jgi:hypothetical protein